MQRLAINIHGAVQGVGFRPFIYHLAMECQIKGWVCNSAAGVMIEGEGKKTDLDHFLSRLQKEGPPHSFIANLQYTQLDWKGYPAFTIKPSKDGGSKEAIILAEIATCNACRNEILDETNRRYRYPFTNCTHCGPRFSIMEKLPYDRAHTSMKTFAMCPQCQKEYTDPANRRFHAQPNACPDCGPTVQLWDTSGKQSEQNYQAIISTAKALQAGKIVAVKGLGGFHLFVDAHNDSAVRLLRKRKGRDEKPFAVMFPDSETVETYCHLSSQEKELLRSGAAPIVILTRKKDGASLAASVSSQNPYYGALLPYTPLHHLLMRAAQVPVVATSGNISNEPICFDEVEALNRLHGIADLFLVHNRPILRPLDDSVLQVVMDRPLMIRRARGYAPLPIPVEVKSECILATGAHLKNTTALKVKDHVFISQHIGNLETEKSLETFEQTIDDFKNLFDIQSPQWACDLHPDYNSTRYAKKQSAQPHAMQHHHAHIVSCMAENQITGPVLGIAWDGSGLGEDGTIWGGEFLLTEISSFKRVGHLRPFGLPGGEKAIHEPRRTALSLLYESDKDFLINNENLSLLKAFTKDELSVLMTMMEKKINAPITSSMGRLFDGVAALIGLDQTISFEGQAAMHLEYIIGGLETEEHYANTPIVKNTSDVYALDWAPMIKQIIGDLNSHIEQARIAAKFHNTLVEMAVSLCHKIGKKNIVLSGGCFQNRYLTEKMITRLRVEDFTVYWHQWVPPNDGGIALGQAACAAQKSPQP